MKANHRRQGPRSLLALALLAPLLAGVAELHLADHGALADPVALDAASVVYADSHPTRPADCLEQPVVERVPHCPACLLRAQSRGGHLPAVARAALPAAAAGCRAPRLDRPVTAALRPPGSRGPPSPA
jgi:hypothetical protein